jgi:hypothetical protein
MGQIILGNRSHGEYQTWLQSPEGQRAAQAEDARVKAQGGPRYSHDGMVHPPAEWSFGNAQTSDPPKQSNAPNMSSYAPPQNQATKAPSMAAYAPPQGGYSAYTPGKAQPTQTPSQGTPYGQLPTTGSPATSYADAWNAAMPKGGNGVSFTPARSVVGAGAGNLAYAQPGQRPEGFVTQSYDLQGNPVAQGQPAQQRDAFIAQILQTPRDTPQYDFQGMLGKAGDMVKDGWQNPFNFNQQQGRGTPPGRGRSRQEIGGDFYDPDPGGIKMMVVSDFYNPQTGEEYSGTGIVPREGTGWVAGKSPLAALKTELAQAERDAAYPPRRWDDATRTVVEGPPGAAEKYAQRAENLRRQIAEMENSGPAGTAQPPSVFRDGDRITKRPGYRPGTAQPTQPQGTGQPSSPRVQGRPDNRMAIQDLFTKNNVQAPQGFMDQLIALLGGSAPPPQMPPRPDVAAPEPNAPVSPPPAQAAATGMASPQAPTGEAKKFRYSFNGHSVVDIPATAAALEERVLQSMSMPLAAGDRYGGGRDSMNKFIDAAEASGVYAAGDIGRMRKLAAAQPSYQEMIDRDAAASWKRKQAEKKSRERPGDHTIILSDGSQVTVDAKGRPIDSPTGGMYVGKSWVANIQR